MLSFFPFVFTGGRRTSYVSILGATRRKAIVQNLTIGSIGITFIYGMLDSSTPNKKFCLPPPIVYHPTNHCLSPSAWYPVGDLFDIFESVPRRVCGEWCRWPVWWWGDSLWSVGWTLQIIVIIRSCVWWIPWFVEHWSFFHLYLPPQLLVSSFRLHSLSSNINTG